MINPLHNLLYFLFRLWYYLKTNNEIWLLDLKSQVDLFSRVISWCKSYKKHLFQQFMIHETFLLKDIGKAAKKTFENN